MINASIAVVNKKRIYFEILQKSLPKRLIENDAFTQNVDFKQTALKNCRVKDARSGLRIEPPAPKRRLKRRNSPIRKGRFT